MKIADFDHDNLSLKITWFFLFLAWAIRFQIEFHAIYENIDYDSRSTSKTIPIIVSYENCRVRAKIVT